MNIHSRDLDFAKINGIKKSDSEKRCFTFIKIVFSTNCYVKVLFQKKKEGLGRFYGLSAVIAGVISTVGNSTYFPTEWFNPNSPSAFQFPLRYLPQKNSPS